MANLSYYHKDGRFLDHTPTSVVTAGKLIRISGVTVMSPNDIAASALGGVDTAGIWKIPYVGGARNVGQNLWWDDNGTPYGGAADGACTCEAANGDWWIGTLAKAAAATDAYAYVAVNRVNPDQPAWQDRAHFTTAVDLTFVEATHSGGVIHVTAHGKIVTLPTGVVGMEVIVVNDVADTGALVTVDLDGNEIIRGANLTIAATKTANNTKTTAKQGDYLHLICTVAATAWRCVGKRGIWVTS